MIKKEVMDAGSRKQDIIRAARVVDVPQLTRLEQETSEQPWSQDALLRELQQPEAYLLVAQPDDSICGYIAVREVLGECSVSNLAVCAGCRRQGIGTTLLQAAMQAAKVRGCVLITLEVRISNIAAIRLYTHQGFAQVGRRPAFYRNPTEDALLLTHYFGGKV